MSSVKFTGFFVPLIRLELQWLLSNLKIDSLSKMQITIFQSRREEKYLRGGRGGGRGRGGGGDKECRE